MSLLSGLVILVLIVFSYLFHKIYCEHEYYQTNIFGWLSSAITGPRYIDIKFRKLYVSIHYDVSNILFQFSSTMVIYP